ncbi:MAG: hypothetical protein ACI88C_002901, partial [Acidimicrobiales bacterium]
MNETSGSAVKLPANQVGLNGNQVVMLFIVTDVSRGEGATRCDGAAVGTDDCEQALHQLRCMAIAAMLWICFNVRNGDRPVVRAVGREADYAPMLQQLESAKVRVLDNRKPVIV